QRAAAQRAGDRSAGTTDAIAYLRFPPVGTGPALGERYRQGLLQGVRQWLAGPVLERARDGLLDAGQGFFDAAEEAREEAGLLAADRRAHGRQVPGRRPHDRERVCRWPHYGEGVRHGLLRLLEPVAALRYLALPDRAVRDARLRAPHGALRRSAGSGR